MHRANYKVHTKCVRHVTYAFCQHHCPPVYRFIKLYFSLFSSAHASRSFSRFGVNFFLTIASFTMKTKMYIFIARSHAHALSLSLWLIFIWKTILPNNPIYLCERRQANDDTERKSAHKLQSTQSARVLNNMIAFANESYFQNMCVINFPNKCFWNWMGMHLQIKIRIKIKITKKEPNERKEWKKKPPNMDGMLLKRSARIEIFFIWCNGMILFHSCVNWKSHDLVYGMNTIIESWGCNLYTCI